CSEQLRPTVGDSPFLPAFLRARSSTLCGWRATTHQVMNMNAAIAINKDVFFRIGLARSSYYGSLQSGYAWSVTMPLMHTHSKLTQLIVLCIVLSIVSGCHKSDSSLKLYVFDCGRLKSGNPAPLIERGVTTTDMSVAAYLIVHPSGILLWDAGVIPDQMIQT